MFELGLWEDPTHKSTSHLIILHCAQFHLQLPKQIVPLQVPDTGRHKTKPGGSKSLEVRKEADSPANFPRLYQVRSNTRARDGFQLEIMSQQLSWSICSSKPDTIKLTTSIWTNASGPAYNADPVKKKKKNSSALAALFFLKFRDLAFSNSAGFMMLPWHNFLTVHKRQQRMCKVNVLKRKQIPGKTQCWGGNQSYGRFKNRGERRDCHHPAVEKHKHLM